MYIIRVWLTLVICKKLNSELVLTHVLFIAGYSCINNILLFYHIKQKDSMLSWVCTVIDYRRHENVVKTSVTHLTKPCLPVLLFYHIWTSSVIYLIYWITAQQHGINLLRK